MEKLIEYYTVNDDGTSTKTKSETVTIEVDLDAEIASKEEEVLAMYKELEALKEQKAAE